MNAKISALVTSESLAFRSDWANRLNALDLAVEVAPDWTRMGDSLAEKAFQILIIPWAELNESAVRELTRARSRDHANFPPLLCLHPSPVPPDLVSQISRFGIDDVLSENSDPNVIQWKIREMVRLAALSTRVKQPDNFETWVENSPDGVVVANAAGTILYTNPALRSLWKAAQRLPENLIELFDPDHRDSVQARIKTLRPKFAPPLRARLWNTLHAQQDVEITHLTLPDDNLLLAVRPVGTCHELDHHAIVSQRLDVLGQLTGGIAHDLNNVLNAVIGGTSLLELDATEALKPQIKTILSTARRGGNLLQQLLLFSRGVDGIMEPIDLNELTRECAAIAADTFPANIEVRVLRAQPEDLPLIEANAAQLHQILMNLCVNARDGMPHGGSLTLSTDRRHLTSAEVDKIAAAKVAGNYVTVKIEDTGQGIPENVRSRIFEPFFTTKPKGKGTGLGLPTVSRLMQLHGGFVDIQSTEGQGTCVSCYFPVGP